LVHIEFLTLIAKLVWSLYEIGRNIVSIDLYRYTENGSDIHEKCYNGPIAC